MKENERDELLLLTRKFVDFAEKQLKNHKLTDEEFCVITAKKYELLNRFADEAIQAF